MNTDQEEKIKSIFVKEKAKSKDRIVAIYRDIAKSVAQLPPEQLAQEVLMLESPKLNAYIQELRKELKAEACEAIASVNLSDAVANIIWANVINKAGLPKVSLCQRQKIKVDHPASEKASGPSKTQQEEINRLESVRNLSIGVVAAGATAGIVTCLIVPGWNSVSGTVIAVKAASILIVGAGTIGAISTQRKIEEINRIVDRAEADAAKSDYTDVINQVCKHQCNVNGRNIHQWLDAVQEELIAQCERELSR